MKQKFEFFDPDMYDSRDECKAAAASRTKELKKEGFVVRRCILRNQQRGYSGFSTSRDCSIRDVFVLNISDLK